MAQQRERGREERSRDEQTGQAQTREQTSMPGPGTERDSTSASAPTADETFPVMPDPSPRPRSRGGGHIAIGYTDRRELDEYLTDEEGDITVRGPIRSGSETRDVAAMRTGATEGMPCLVVPLVYERIDEIRREVDSVLDRFGTGPSGERTQDTGVRGDVHDRARRDAEYLRRQPDPRTIGETGGETRGAGPGAYRTGSADTEPSDESLEGR